MSTREASMITDPTLQEASMKFGFIGAGVVAQTIARHLLPFGHEVLLSNSRGPATLSDIVDRLGQGAVAGTPQQEAAQDFVVLSVDWPRVLDALAGRKRVVEGKSVTVRVDLGGCR